MKSVFLFVLFSIFKLTNVYAQSKPIVSDIIIRGVITDDQLIDSPTYKSEVKIEVSELPFTLIELAQSPKRSFIANFKSGEGFEIKIPAESRFYYMYISYSTPSSNFNSLQYNFIDNIYIIEKGDIIDCSIRNFVSTFSGKGAAKLQCQNEIYALRFYDDELNNRLSQDSSFSEALVELEKKCDSVIKLQNVVINKYKNVLDSSEIIAMKANATGLQYYRFLRGLGPRIKIYKILLASEFYKNIGKNLAGMDPIGLSMSPVYSSVLLQKIHFEASIVNDSISELKDSLYYQRCVDLVESKYSNFLKDKLLTLLIVSGKVAVKKHLEAIARKVKSPLYANAMDELKFAFSKGRDFQKYVLTDYNGNALSFSQFKDKIVILDFWYTGCYPCAKLRTSFEPIHEKFHSNPRVLFVSVSIDKEFESWKKSIDKNIYTFPTAVNLFTNGKGGQHPIVLENLINAYPQIYILKNGIVYSANPPRPSGNSYNFELDPNKGTINFMSLIQQALDN